MIIKSNDPNKDLTKYLKTRRILELPIHTYFNEGQGLKFFSDGVMKSQKLYNNLNDFDYAFPYRTKKVFQKCYGLFNKFLDLQFRGI